jgi:hypothetical protein
MNDLAALVPGTISIVFPNGGDGSGPASGFYEATVTLASLNLPQYAGITGAPWSNTLNRYELAVYASGTLTNQSAILQLAQQAATDWYLWQLARLDQQYLGYQAWTPEGLHDIEWRQADCTITTRIMRGVFDPLEDLLFQAQAEDSPCPEWRDQCDDGFINRYKSIDCGQNWDFDQFIAGPFFRDECYLGVLYRYVSADCGLNYVFHNYLAGPFYADKCDIGGVINRYVSTDCGLNYVYDSYVAGPFYRDTCDAGGILNRYKSADCGATYGSIVAYLGGPFYRDQCDNGTLNRYKSPDCGKSYQYDITLAKPLLTFQTDTYCANDGFWHNRQRLVITGGCTGQIGPWIDTYTSCSPCTCPSSSSISSSQGCSAPLPCCPIPFPCVLCITVADMYSTAFTTYMATYDPTTGMFTAVVGSCVLFFGCAPTSSGHLFQLLVYTLPFTVDVYYAVYDNCTLKYPFYAEFLNVLTFFCGPKFPQQYAAVYVSPWPCQTFGSSSSISGSQSLSISQSTCLGNLLCGTLTQPGTIDVDCCPGVPLPKTLKAKFGGALSVLGTVLLTWNGFHWDTLLFNVCNESDLVIYLQCDNADGDFILNLFELDIQATGITVSCTPTLEIDFSFVSSGEGCTGAATCVVTPA